MRSFSNPPAGSLLACVCLTLPGATAAQATRGALEEVVVTGRLDFDWRTLDAAILNLTGREPPRVYRQLNYDPLTHNPLGRMVEVGVRWELY